jgi:hypothetical protein
LRPVAGEFALLERGFFMFGESRAQLPVILDA